MPWVSVTNSSSRRSWWIVAVVAGLLLGPADLWGQVNTPYPWAHVFNSPSVWAAAAFGYGRWVHRRLESSVGAVVLLAVAVEAYYLADVLVRGASRSILTAPTAAVWLGAAVVGGLIFGLAGAWSTARLGWLAVVGRAALPALFGAEAVRHLMRRASEHADSRPDDLGQLAAILGVVGATLLFALAHRLDRRTTTLVVAVAVGAAVTVGAIADALV